MKKLKILSYISSLFSSPQYEEAKEITTAELYGTIIPNMSKPIVIDFFATWCGPCRLYHNTYMSVSRMYSDRAEFYGIDIDQNRQVCCDYSIKSVPTNIVLFSNEGDFLSVKGAINKTTQKQLVDEGVKESENIMGEAENLIE